MLRDLCLKKCLLGSSKSYVLSSYLLCTHSMVRKRLQKRGSAWISLRDVFQRDWWVYDKKITPEEDNQEGKWGTLCCGISGQISVRNFFTPTNEIWVCSWLWKTKYFYCHALCTHLQLISSQAEWAVDARVCFNHRSNLCLLFPLWQLGGGNWGRALDWHCLDPSWVFLFPWSHICHMSICAAPEVPEIFVEDKNLKVPASMYNLGSEFR